MNQENFIWWKHGVIYQIYPRSFHDSNGDGVGDIHGIIQKLDYLHELGVNGIWLSPMYSSPMYDMGYDISDYRSIDPVFGSLEDFKRLVKEAHLRKIHVIMDLVLNHTSHEHPWFRESRSGRDNPKRDWYIWHDGKKGKPPNNWRAAFGGRAWTWDEQTEQYYLHLFLEQQPDLNWRNPEVRKAVFNDIKYWLDLGVDGFRLDVINYIVKDSEFRNNPYGNFSGYPRRYDLQLHRHDRNQEETHEILKKLRSMLDKYGETMTVGEIYPNEGRMEPEITATYLGKGNDELNLAFDFSPIYARFSAAEFRKILTRWYEAIPEGGWPCHVFSNHDQSRSMDRLAKGSIPRAKLLAALLLTQKGTPFIYYGEEIGMSNGKIRRSELADPVGIRYWPFHPGRDPQRTPMQWSLSKNAGFTEGRPWLPVNENYQKVNVQKQDDSQSSLLNFYRRLIHLRRSEEALHNGGWKAVDAGRDVLAYYRTGGESKFFVALNFSGRTRFCSVDDKSRFEIEISTERRKGEWISIRNIPLAPYEVLIARKV